MEERPRLLIITGPTAVGKTAVSLELAEALGGEIVSCDSMQLYRGMDIGTAKAAPEERARVPHHLIDVLEPEEPCSVADFAAMGQAAVEEILSRGRLPILVGGTGFYIQAVVKGLDFSEGAQDDALRTRLRKEAETAGPEALHARLAAVDPASAAAIHPNNLKRVIRALEYYEQTGRPISALNEAQKTQEGRYDAAYFVLDLPRKTLYERIDARVDAMMAAGLPDEVRALLARGVPADSTAMQGIGYKELAAHLRGDCTLEEATAQIRLATRHYAKRQLTWLRRVKDAVWIEKTDYPDDAAAAEAVRRIFLKRIGAAAAEKQENPTEIQ